MISTDVIEDTATALRPNDLQLVSGISQGVVISPALSGRSSLTSGPDSPRATADYLHELDTPLQDSGILERRGDMTLFVVDDLTEKIRASALKASRSRSASSGSLSSRTSWTSSYYGPTGLGGTTASGISRSSSYPLQLSPDDVPAIDPHAVADLETHARRVADQLQHMMGSLQISLHRMSALTVGCLHTYAASVDRTCDTVDHSIKAMYALMAKCEELSKCLRPIDGLQLEITNIKRALDRLENVIKCKDGSEKN